MVQSSLLISLFSLAFAFGISPIAAAVETGIGPRSILIGQSASFTGPSGELGREFRKGSHIAFHDVNSRGGVHGRQIITVYRDDRYEPDRTLANTKKFLDKDRVFALFGYIGTAPVLSAMPLFEQRGVPLIAPVTGAQALRHPINKYIFNLRSSYHHEILTLVDYLRRYGRLHIAVVYQNDAFGRDGLAGLLKALKPFGRRPVAMETVERNSTDTHEAARRVARSKPDAVLLVSSYVTNASFIQHFRKYDSTAQIVNLSFVGSTALVRSLPRNLLHGIGITQVVPFPWDAGLPIVRDYQMAMKRAYPGSQWSFSSFEGYMAARYLIATLQDIGPQPTRQALMQSLDEMAGKDLGGFPLSTRDRHRQGSPFVQLTFIKGQTGSFIH